jgi:hypothetical protein
MPKPPDALTVRYQDVERVRAGGGEIAARRFDVGSEIDAAFCFDARAAG